MQLFVSGVKMLHYFVTCSARGLSVFLVSLRLSGLLARATFYPGTARVMYRMSLGVVIAKILMDWHQLLLEKGMGSESLVAEVVPWFIWVCSASLMLMGAIV
jgi:hypothetical protein